MINESGVEFKLKDSDGKTITFEDAKSDWEAVTYKLDEYRIRLGGVVFANTK